MLLQGRKCCRLDCVRARASVLTTPGPAGPDALRIVPGMTAHRPLRRKAALLAATTSLALLLGACSSDAPDEATDRPVERVQLDGDTTPAPSPTAEEEEEPTATAEDPTASPGPDTSPDEGGHGHGDPVEVTGDTRGPATAEGYDPNNPLPVGLTVDEWAVEWEEGQAVARDYIQARYTLSHNDPHPSQWLLRARDLSTPKWYAELQRAAVQSELTDEQWAQAQADELEYHVQMLEPLTLDIARPFGKDEMWVRVPYRSWETSRLSRGDHPSGWNMNDRSWGARGAKFTLMHLVHDEATDTWLVNEEGVTAMSPIDS